MIAATRRAQLRGTINALVRMRRIRLDLDLGPDPVLEEALNEARAELKALTAELAAA
jgi:hypothetical protein